MKKSHVYEMEWRELLVKRLQTPLAVLKRDVAAETKSRAEARKLAAGYESYEEAHEAYGWGYITQKQLDAIEAIFDEVDVFLSRDALKRMSQFIGSLEGEIKMLRNDPEYREEIIGTEEHE